MTTPDDDVGAAARGPVPRRRTGRTTKATAAMVVMALAALGATWWFGTVHPGMHLSDSGVTETCVVREAPSDRDFAIGGVTFLPSDDVELLSVELVDPVNVRLVDADVVPTVAQPGGGTLIQHVGRWPLTPGERDALTVDWSRERALTGAQLDGGVEEMPLLHVSVVDPSRDASFEAWRVVYRMFGTRWESTFTQAFRTPAGPDALLSPTPC